MPDCSNTLSGSRCRRAAAAGLIFFRPPRPCALLPPPPRLFVFVGPAPTAGACLRPLRYCLSVRLSVALSYN